MPSVARTAGRMDGTIALIADELEISLSAAWTAAQPECPRITTTGGASCSNANRRVAREATSST